MDITNMKNEDEVEGRRKWGKKKEENEDKKKGSLQVKL